MPEVPHIGAGLASSVSRAHESKALSVNNGPSSVLERPKTRDVVEISAVAHKFERMADKKEEIRYDLVDRIRQQIADGSYESEQRLTDATERLLSELDS